jgi:hypothetical protein
MPLPRSPLAEVESNGLGWKLLVFDCPALCTTAQFNSQRCAAARVVGWPTGISGGFCALQGPEICEMPRRQERIISSNTEQARFRAARHVASNEQLQCSGECEACGSGIRMSSAALTLRFEIDDRVLMQRA